jgi:ribosomal-protein-alanine N-acetyltransferase
MEHLIHKISIRIRPMAFTDIDQVMVIEKESFSTPWPKSAYLYELKENKNAIHLVAAIDNGDNNPQIVGLLVLWIIVDEAHIATLAVLPEYRRNGIARQLLIHGLNQAAKQGTVIATLEVRENNIPAQELYREFGFVNVGRRIRYYRDNNEDAIIMTLTNLDQIQWEHLITEKSITV